MRELCTLFVTRSRLLADLIAHAMAARLAQKGFALRAEIAADEAEAFGLLPVDLIVRFEGEPRSAALDGVAASVTVGRDLESLAGATPDPSESLADSLTRALIGFAD
jgi:hypothetical protein